MKARPVVPRGLAQRDVEDAFAHYLAEATKTVTLGFIDALEKAYSHISRHPAAELPRYAPALNLPGLRLGALPSAGGPIVRSTFPSLRTTPL